MVGTAILIESEMALFYECMLKCDRKLLDTADIVRDAIFQQLTNTFPVAGETGSEWGFPKAFFVPV